MSWIDIRASRDLAAVAADHEWIARLGVPGVASAGLRPLIRLDEVPSCTRLRRRPAPPMQMRCMSCLTHVTEQFASGGADMGCG